MVTNVAVGCRDADYGGGCVGVGAAGMWEISVLPLNVAVNLKLL